MYQFITGPLLWFAFTFFIIGCFVRVVIYIRGLDWRLDRVTYTKNVSFGMRGAIRSITLWLIPYGTRSWRANHVYTLIIFIFHFGILFTPVFLSAHNIIMMERWGIRLKSIPDGLADIMTIAVIVIALLLILRRIALPHVRILTNTHDILVLAITVAPFITGFFAYHQVPGSEFWTLVHILTGEALLIAIPLTKLSHVVHFFCTRAQIGIDFGVKRGGMKSGGMKW
jgi:nitrate reductase gamma subunit